MIDRTEVNRALAKAIAYKQCGNDSAAQAWAVKLITMLECENILTTSIRAWADNQIINQHRG